ncbi:NADH-quinone oxidoreductase subunit N [Emticicia sp. CRIBPO]|uniref:NADH-quinone oxidoreductase subunit N n=1 Tax=Emticicia sp. CRIBPO TaxID=2683258 RepID=UPI00141203C0|nr:NADH-quinone oxidoreductase subunit N [Emticicia sp. CRIBPO]NBA86963.1 NADH-quinone oxidoreductase subunit N [Emticicia sp. CRIBPO]
MNKHLQEIIESTRLILPEVILIAGILLLTGIVSFTKKTPEKPKFKRFYFYSFALVILYYSFSHSHYEALFEKGDAFHAFGDILLLDKGGMSFRYLIQLSVFLFLLHGVAFRYRYDGEYFILIFTAVLGMAIMTMTTHFMGIYIGIELVSIASYLLVSLNKKKENFEAGIKYLIFGATSSALMLYGISLFYGISHTLNFLDPLFLHSIHFNADWAVQSICFLVLGGILFKMAAAPFHIWAPDVYEATPAPIISFLSYAPKVAALLLMARFIEALHADFTVILSVIIIVSLFVGNFSALWQKDAKRMLGYSGIAHAGFMLIGLLKAGFDDFYSAYFYAAAYLPVTMGAFFLLDVFKKQAGSYLIEDFKGLGQHSVILGINAIILMVALTGLPPTIGFTAKLLIFSSVADSLTSGSSPFYFTVLAFGLINTAVSIYYYLKIPYIAVVKSRYKTHNLAGIPLHLLLILTLFSLSAILLFIYPQYLGGLLNNI